VLTLFYHVGLFGCLWVVELVVCSGMITFMLISLFAFGCLGVLCLLELFSCVSMVLICVGLRICLICWVLFVNDCLHFVCFSVMVFAVAVC